MRAGMEFSPVREELRRLWRELRGQKLTPAQAAASTALGLLAGSLPLAAATWLLVVAACIWCQLDGLFALAAFALASFSHDLLAHRLLGTGALPQGLAAIGLTAAGAALTFVVVLLLPKAKPRPPYLLPSHAPAWVTAVERVARRFAAPYSPRPTERARFHYIRTKLLGDPAAKLIAEVSGDAPHAFGELLDVGTGRGQIPLLLLELGFASSARGIDWDERKIAAAQQAATAQGDSIAPLNAAFTPGDVRTAPLEPADTVLLVDVLHYFTVAEQDAILDRAAAAVRPGGRLLVREADPERGWRSLATLLEERFFTLVRFNRGERVRFRPMREIASRLERAGLRSRPLSAWGKTPFSNVLLVAERPADALSSSPAAG